MQITDPTAVRGSIEVLDQDVVKLDQAGFEARRVRALACSFEHLGPGGRVLVTFLSAYRGQNEAPPPASRGFWHAVNPEHEPGDHYLLNETVHVYRCAEELCDEAVEAGFEVEVVHRDQRAYDKADGLVRGYAVFRKPA